jgi:hypothetical protein
VLPVLLLALLVAAATMTTAVAATRVKVLRPSSSICAGAKIKVGVRHRRGTNKRFRIQVKRPSGSVLWSKSGRARKRWRSWFVTLTTPGLHRVNYRIPGKDRAFNVQVNDCTPAGLTDNDGGAAALSIAESGPGQSVPSCIVVTYTGSIPITVRLHGATGGTGLAGHMDLTVTRGMLPAGTSFGSCEGFVADETDYLGHGPGVMYRGTLAGFPDDYDNGLEDPVSGAAASWTTGASHAYMFEAAVQDDNAAQGLTATQDFVWEGRG